MHNNPQHTSSSTIEWLNNIVNVFLNSQVKDPEHNLKEKLELK